MSTINEKLVRLEQYKNDIKEAITNKGQSVGNNMAEFAEAISKISGGGGDEPVFSDTDPLTFVRIEDVSNGYISLNDIGTINTKVFQYNKNGTGWQKYTIGDKIYLQKYEYVQFRSTDNNPVSTSTTKYRMFNTNGIYKTYGQLSSLYTGTKFTSSYMFYYLFRRTNIITAPKLPNIVTQYCYAYMFQDCSLLVNAPALPATTLAAQCYYQMFSGCTSLVNAPALPATTLAIQCYYQMFNGCSLLVNAPALPATTLAQGCYCYMFSGCTSLVNAPALPATTLAAQCYYQMFSGCTSLVNAPALPATTLISGCYGYMFRGCSLLVNAPELPATTLVSSCYESMFQNCSKLNYIKVGATSWSTGYANSWVSGVASTGTFVKPASTSISTGTSGIPSKWTVQDA